MATYFWGNDGEGRRLFFGELGVGDDFFVWSINGLSAFFLAG